MRNAKKKACRTSMESRDRFSELPDALVHRILSLVPTVDAVRMSVLSKRWRNVWYSLPVLEFLGPEYDSDSESYYAIKYKEKKYGRFVSKCFKLRKMDIINFTDMAVTKFKLKIVQSKKKIDYWLWLIAQSHAKELDLYIMCYGYTNYELPGNVLRIRSLTHLALSQVYLEDNIGPISLPCLVSLSLKNVTLKDETLTDLLSGCSALEKLLLHYCCKLSTPRVSSSSLRFVDVVVYGHQAFRIEAMNLDSAKFGGFFGPMRPNLNLQSCGTIRNLSFCSIPLDVEWLKDLIRKLPCLESLTVDSYRLKHVKIFSEHLRNFTFREINSLKSEITIDAPNLVHFSYEWGSGSDISVNVPNLQGARVKFIHFNHQYDANWYMNLICFLSGLGCCKTMCLHVYSKETLILPNRLGKVIKAPLPVLKHLKVMTRSHWPLSKTNDFKDSLLLIMPSLETVSVAMEK